MSELIVTTATAGYEKVPPQAIERAMRDAMPFCSSIVVVGNSKRFLSMLLSLETEPDSDVLSDSVRRVSATIGSQARTVQEVIDDPRWTEHINAMLHRGNLQAESAAQIVHRWKILPRSLSQKEGELTPTLKVKRDEVAAHFQDVIHMIYSDDIST